MTHRLILTFI